MCKNFSQLKNAEAVNVWIYRILMSRCSDILKKRNKTVSEADIDDVSVYVADDNAEFIPEKYAEDRELSRQLYAIIMNLPLAKREAVLMYYYDGLNHKEIAKIKGITEKSVSGQIAKARTMIKERLEKQNNKRAVLGAAAPISVLSRVLEQNATEQLPDNLLAEVNKRALETTINIPLSSSVKTVFSAKVIYVVAAIVIIAVGLTFAAMHYDPRASETASVTEVSDVGPNPSALSYMVDSIAFIGGECDCGHENPKEAHVNWTDNVDYSHIKTSYEIEAIANGEILYTGESDSVSEPLKELKAGNREGRYRLSFYIEDEAHNIVTMSRELEIGDFS
jgi:RNA polymerase sigma factor (sigma-70 family)